MARKKSPTLLPDASDLQLVRLQADEQFFIYYWDLTTTTTTEVTQSPQKKVTTSETGKTLLGWLQLLGVIAIPIVVGFGTAFFTRQQAKTSEANRQQQHETDLQVAENQQQEELLRIYFDKLSELLLDKELSTNPNIQSIVRARTLAVLHILNTERKAIVLRFLYDAGLLQYVKSFLYELDLSNTDLNRINLSEALMSRANLSRAKLVQADLSRAKLSGANLSGAVMSEVNLSEANLSGANLSEAWLSGGGAGLSAADLSGAKLIQSNLYKANLRRAKLYRASMTAATLEQANLSGADMAGAWLSGANLNGANLSGANLSGANLTKADLRGAIGVTVEELEKQSVIFSGAIMPDGKIYT